MTFADALKQHHDLSDMLLGLKPQLKGAAARWSAREVDLSRELAHVTNALGELAERLAQECQRLRWQEDHPTPPADPADPVE